MAFECPVGAAADLRELEYVSALHQTVHDESFMDGSIETRDIQYFLRSRYGIFITKEEVKKSILKGFAGGDGDEDCLDIEEMVAVLIIPLLLKVAHKKKKNTRKTREDFLTQKGYLVYLKTEEERKELEPPPRIISEVLKNILIDSEEYILDKPPKLTKNLICKIFGSLNELELIVDDELVDQMIKAAAVDSSGDKNLVLDSETFTRALTKDVLLYDTSKEDSYSHTFDDVFGGVEATKENNNEVRIVEQDLEVEISENEEDSIPETKNVKTIFALGQIDSMADNTKSTLHVTAVWFGVILFFLNYIVFGKKLNSFSCGKNINFGCLVGFAVLNWLILTLKLIILGTAIGIGLSCGNSILGDALYGSFIGLASNILFIFLPFFIQRDFFVISTTISPDALHETLSWMLFVAGVVLTIIQIRNLIQKFFLSKEMLAKNTTNKFLTFIFGGSALQRSFRFKQASSFKINRLVRNAYDLHGFDDNKLTSRGNRVKELFGSTKDTSSRSNALLNYTKISEKTEKQGGTLWAWKEFATGSLQMREGIWIHSRLIAGNMVQFAFVFVIFALFIYYGVELIGTDEAMNYKFGTGEGYAINGQLVVPSKCNSTFDFNNCIISPVGIAVCTNVFLDDSCKDYMTSVGLNSTKDIFRKSAQEFCSLVDISLKDYFNQTLKDNSVCSSFYDETLESIFENTTVKLNSTKELIKCQSWERCGSSSNKNPECKELLSGTTNSGTTTISSSVCAEALHIFDNSLPNFADMNKALIAECKHFVNTLVQGELYNRTENLCESLIYIPNESVRSVDRNGANSYCSVDVTACVDTVFMGHVCLLGFDYFNSLSWEGPSCEDHLPEKAIKTAKLTFGAIAQYLPKPLSIRITIGFGVVTAFFTALFTSFVVIPSAIHTIMKFRTGVIPSLRDKYFLRYRSSLNNMAFMIGAMLWGILSSTVMVTFLVCLIVFAIAWHVTRPYIAHIMANIVALAITMTLKKTVIKVVGNATFAGFYRKKLWQNNVFAFALECWYLALGLYSMVTRLVLFIVTISIHIGRIDKPVLDKDLKLQLDKYPILFRQDLLSGEAHRHPYLDRLGTLYMMKLRYGSQFANTAGAAWRLLFVAALMPWLRQHRIRDENFDASSHELQARIDSIKKEENEKTMLKAILEESNEDENIYKQNKQTIPQ